MINLRTNMILLLGLLAVGCGGEASVPATPDGTVLACARAITENDPGVLWAALPASYQNDVTSLVHDAAAKMDAEVYDKTFVLLNKALGVMKGKKEYILELIKKDATVNMMVQDTAEVEKNWSHLVELLALITDSEIKTLSSLKSLDVGRFVDRTGSEVMAKIDRLSEIAPQDDFGKLKKTMASLKVEVVSIEGDTARISMIVEGEDSPDEESMVRVEGKWIPKDLADAWKDMIAEANKSVSEMTGEELKQQKPMIMGMMTGIETTLDQLAEAKSSEEFSQILEQLKKNMMGM
jgi:hypothetical protein